MNQDITEIFGEVISSYSRAQAIEDGVLVDVDDIHGTIRREAGFKFPIALTTKLFEEVINPDRRSVPLGQSVEGRLWDALHMLRMAIAKRIPSKVYSDGCSQITIYQCYFIMKRAQRRLLKIKAVCGPGDNGEPVITLMCPEED